MSAIGNRIAIVSLGLSCQTSRQIDIHVELLGRLTGDRTLKQASLPFDWLISTARGLAGMLEDRSFLPQTEAGFCADHGRLRLRAHDVIYWHESRSLAQAGDPAFRDIQAKFEHTSARFKQIADADRVVAVISDTQPNLPSIEKRWQFRLVDTTPQEADSLRATFAKFLGRPVEMLMVSRNARPNLQPPQGFAYYHMVPEREGWIGNREQWAAVFTDYFKNRKTAETQSLGSARQWSGVNVEDDKDFKSREMAAATLTQLIVQSAPVASSGGGWDEKTILETYRRCFRYVGILSADPRYQP
ncbi:MAG: papain-like cysteine peptidase [Pseudomonadota bacterium]|nr:papain-like cysteine peptidase [Pseudomonadota bacterium]